MHPEISNALAELGQFLKVEGDNPKPAALIRHMVKLTRRGSTARTDILIAAFGLKLAGLPVDADGISWLVRDAKLGFPDEPPFDF